ncbi:uncharacterized protein L969DRAFT_408187 [Mixia osmundae IAM 14324]|uniref:Derlin n=1 Tax=Mixia osmundae (strain CBS 9802 / IAM 14324 / JCM 22182 / KY 12970) TaxID=764103 RepID=G7E8S1_MIXOS|nr:uncharacterized protein L969DRAFT_408187 [Mixia osmundae IAM 14324]KEI40175.1 hypothetical protein L969DRAFT_408187 [Mixia osmundae IAM 14324]GAA99539.1 hypothetical protein E5Q_06240 [Mixia osmundae IAM 14324]
MDLQDTPPITKAYLIASVGTSIAVQCNIVNAFQLFHTYRATFESGQLWRLLTTFLYFGNLSLDFFFHIFFFMRYSKMIEENAFHGRKADYLWMLLISATLLLILSPLSPSPFLSSPLSFTLVYLWSRLNPNVRLSLFGLITITAPYLPYALVAFSWVLSSSWNGVVGDLLGIAVGHTYFFLSQIWSKERSSNKRNWLATPTLLTRLLDGPQALERRDD